MNPSSYSVVSEHPLLCSVPYPFSLSLLSHQQSVWNTATGGVLNRPKRRGRKIAVRFGHLQYERQRLLCQWGSRRLSMKTSPSGDPNRSAEIRRVHGLAFLGDHHLTPGRKTPGAPAHVLHVVGTSIGEQAPSGLGGTDGGPGTALREKRNDRRFDIPMHPRPGPATAGGITVSKSLPVPVAHPARLDAASAVGADFYGERCRYHLAFHSVEVIGTTS